MRSPRSRGARPPPCRGPPGGSARAAARGPRRPRSRRRASSRPRAPPARRRARPSAPSGRRLAGGSRAWQAGWLALVAAGAAGGAALEALHAATRVDQLLLARVERVAVRADLHVDLGLGRAGRELVAAGAADVSLDVLGMDVGLHGVQSRATLHGSPL